MKIKGAKITLVLAIIMVLSIALSGCTQKEVVAKVNDIEITKDEFYDELVTQSGDEVLNALISEKIIEAEIKKQNIVISDEEMQTELDEMTEYYGGEEEMNNALAYYGYSIDDMKKNIKINLQLEKVLEPLITITDEEMETYFTANKASLDQAEEVKASHILVETKEKAEEVIAKLDGGGDFAELAKEYSTDSSNSATGGDLGYFGKGEMVPEFDEAVFSMAIDEISEPVETSYGFHIIKVVDHKEAKVATLEESKELIKDTIFQSKMGDAYNTWYTEKVEEYEITNYLTDKTQAK